MQLYRCVIALFVSVVYSRETLYTAVIAITDRVVSRKRVCRVRCYERHVKSSEARNNFHSMRTFLTVRKQTVLLAVLRETIPHSHDFDPSPEIPPPAFLRKID